MKKGVHQPSCWGNTKQLRSFLLNSGWGEFTWPGSSNGHDGFARLGGGFLEHHVRLNAYSLHGFETAQNMPGVHSDHEFVSELLQSVLWVDHKTYSALIIVGLSHGETCFVTGLNKPVNPAVWVPSYFDLEEAKVGTSLSFSKKTLSGLGAISVVHQGFRLVSFSAEEVSERGIFLWN